jgi:hypothetical protein
MLGFLSATRNCSPFIKLKPLSSVVSIRAILVFPLFAMFVQPRLYINVLHVLSHYYIILNVSA